MNNTTAVFLNKLDYLLSNLRVNVNKKIVLGGDVNIDLLKVNAISSKFMDLLNSFSFFPTIKDYTRITTTSKSCIGNIFLNFHKNFVASEVIFSALAQLLILTERFKVIETTNCFRRIFSEDNINTFSRLLNSENWEDIYLSSDPNSKFKISLKLLDSTSKQHFCVKKLQVKKIMNHLFGSQKAL